MPVIIIKCDPPQIEPLNEFSVSVPPYKKCRPADGDEAFVWTSEDEGGTGLAFHGTLLSAASNGGRGGAYTLRVRIEGYATEGAPSRAALRTHRDSEADGPMPKLARKLYTHALNKMACLQGDEIIYLRTFFL
ncbi:MAG: hypothetical protein ACREDL_01585 [Bradyrhizobium sp.]